MLFTQRDRGHLGVGEEIGVKLEICQVANLCRDGHCILSMMFFSGWTGKVKMRRWKWKSESEKTKVKKVRVKSENVVMKRRTPYFVRFSCLRFLLASSGPIHYTKRAKFPPSKVIYKPFCVFKDQVHSQEPHPPLSSHRWSISPARGEVLFLNISDDKFSPGSGQSQEQGTQPTILVERCPIRS